MKKYILFIAFLTAFLVAATAQNKRIAILETIDKENQVPYAVEVMVRSNLTKVISNTEGYEGYDRVNISEIMDEHDFERTGLVNEDQIRQLGEIAGADYILVSEAVKFDESNIFVTAKILNVVSAKTEGSENALMGMTAQDIQEGCESLARRLLGLSDTPIQGSIAASPGTKAQTVEKDGNIAQPETTTNGVVGNILRKIADKTDEIKARKNAEKAVEQNGRIGEIIDFPDGSRGVVFYFEKGKGLVVSLNEGEEVWDKNRRYQDVSAIRNIRDDEGFFEYGEGLSNTNALINLLGNEARAAYWCVQQGEGWYLPSCGELMVLMNVVKKDSFFVKTLKLNHSNEISGWYWTSSENDKDEAWSVNAKGSSSTKKKSEEIKVRAIRSFSE